jgi:5'-deoxynucleotidase YfbR-like HD superfamily hydrolase
VSKDLKLDYFAGPSSQDATPGARTRNLQVEDHRSWSLSDVAQQCGLVAEHSFRVGILAYVIAVQEGANADRAATLGLFHDLPETRTGDANSISKRYVRAASPHIRTD